MKLIVAGSRTFKDYELLQTKLDSFLKNVEQVEIVSGCAAGADKLGERYAKDRGYKIKSFPANWSKYGKRAGYLRNVEMAEYAEACVCFWDGVSPGTKLMIQLAMDNGLTIEVIRTDHLIRRFSPEDLKGLWEFASAQRQLIVQRHANSTNSIELTCLAFTANCIADIMDEILALLESPQNNT